jgi:hypothetical protein
MAQPYDVEPFIQRWSGREGGQERANYALFLTELCSALSLPAPDPADASRDANDYVFERVVVESLRDGATSNRRIDLYKRDAFVLEAKQSRQSGAKALPDQPGLLPEEPAARGRRSADRRWDDLMMNARQQAEAYVRWLPEGHVPPPFVIVCDVGHCFEIYANFRRDGKVYDQFPDRQNFRIYLEDLRRPEIQETLAAIWRDPESLDPARRSAKVTRDIAQRLAAVSAALEAEQLPAEEVAMFLMRCLFTMFAEDIGLLPEKSFQKLLERCEANPEKLEPLVGQLWEAMDEGKFAIAIEAKVKRFNGQFFKSRRVLPLTREAIGELRQAASHNWRDVDPSIFGALLEQALKPADRRSLGAHYTPRAYVERLVIATVIEPLRRDWAEALITADKQKTAGRPKDAIKTVQKFHKDLCGLRILDPACGTGNFLYVSLELLKRLEGEVLEALTDLGGQEALAGFEGLTVDPHQFLGLEVNARAAAIAELVLWIGYLQWHVRTQTGLPSEPILRAFRNIEVKNAVLTAEKTLARDPTGKPLTKPGPDGEAREIYRYANPRRPDWPTADFIVGNPPFIGGKDLRARLGDEEAEALWQAHPKMNDSADFVMYWWDHAAELLTRKGTKLRRFGLVTTNSISQVFQRRTIDRHLSAKKPISLVMAIPDHPWTKAAPDSAAVRIAMTVAEAGSRDGALREVIAESGLETDAPQITLVDRPGRIHSDLTVGPDVTAAGPLLANEGVCSPGVKLHGAGFIVTPQQAEALGLGRRPGLERHIRQYRNGRDLTAHSRGVMVIDLYGLTDEEVLRRFPEVYQHLLMTVKPERDLNNRATYRDNWWLFGEPRTDLRSFTHGLNRFIATVETTKHRLFQFLDAAILPDNKIVSIGSNDAFTLGVLSSRVHVVWALRAGGWLGVGNDSVYVKSRCFDPFPFPDASEPQKRAIRAIAEELDGLRKRVLADHPELTLTGLYNVLEKLRGGIRPADLDQEDRHVLDVGLVLILKELHDRLDHAVAEAYGWPAELEEEEILYRVVALNKARAREEAQGLVRWLRPDYQAQRFGGAQQRSELDLAGAAQGQGEAPGARPAFPAEEAQQTALIMFELAAAQIPLKPDALAQRFRQGRRVEPAVAATLDAILRMGFLAGDRRSGYQLRADRMG